MPGRTSLAYRLLASLAVGAVPLAAPFSGKLRHGHRGRVGSEDHLRRWADRERNRARPLVWFHAASVGEGLQAAAVIERLRAHRPGWQIAFTHFSPSAQPFAAGLPVDLAGYVPYDRPAACRAALAALAPSALVFAKLDLWPELATAAARQGTAVGLIGASVSPRSRRLRQPTCALCRPGYAAVTRAGAVSDADAARLHALGVPHERIEVTGDPRYDAALDRVREVRADDPVLALAPRPVTLVAGSTWPGDEAVVLRAFREVRRQRPDARLILAPHEPRPPRLRSIAQQAGVLGLPSPERLDDGARAWTILLVDRVGLLAALYGAGALAYVGGGFGRAGLHSVIEPAAWAVPPCFGPAWGDSRDARLLLEAGAACALPSGRPDAVRVLVARWLAWLGSEPEREAAGARALAVVEADRGAADRAAALVERLVEGRERRGGGERREG